MTEDEEMLMLLQENPGLIDDPDIVNEIGADVAQKLKSEFLNTAQAPAQEEAMGAVQPQVAPTEQVPFDPSKVGLYPDITPDLMRSALTGQLTSLAEPAISAVKSPFIIASDVLSEARKNNLGLADTLKLLASNVTDDDRLEKAIELDLLERKKFKSEYPAADAAAQFGGALIPTGMNVGSGAFKLAGKASQYIPTMGRAADAIVRGGATGILSSAGLAGLEEAGQQAQEAITGGEVDLSKIPERALEAAGPGLLLGGGIPAVSETIKKLPTVGKKALTVFLGVPDEVVTTYIKNIERINRAPDKEVLTKHVADLAHDIVGDVANKKTKLDQAASALKSIEDDLAEKFQTGKDESLKIIENAKRSLQDFKEFTSSSLREKANLTPLTPKVLDSIDSLKSRITEGSKRATQVLEQVSSDITSVPSSPIVREIENQISKLKVGTKAITPSSKSAVRVLTQLKDDIASLGDSIGLGDVKKILEQIDTETMNAYGKTDFNPVIDNALTRIRKKIDISLKDIAPDEYKNIMKSVSDDMNVFKSAVKIFKDEASIERRLKSFTGAVPVEKKALVELGKKTGVNYQSYLDEAENAKKTLSSDSGLRGLMESSKQFKDVTNAEEAFVKHFGIGKKEFIARGSGQARTAVEKAKNELKAITEINKNLGELTRSGKEAIDENSEKIVRQYLVSRGNRGNKVIRQVSKLSDNDFKKLITDPDFKQWMDDAAVIEQFNKKSIQPGSSLTNAASEIGGAIGKSLGRAALGGVVGWFAPGDDKSGAGLGATIGLIANIFGPRVAKKILDSAYKLGNNPSIQKLNSLKLPPKANEFLKAKIIEYNARIKNKEGDKNEK